MKEYCMVMLSEAVKLKKSRVMLITVGYFFIICVFMVYLMFRCEEIEHYFSLSKLYGTIIFVAGEIGFGFVTSWVFGREYTEHTVKDLLALPSPRFMLIISKFAILFAFFFTLSMACFIIPYLVGMIKYPDIFSLKIIIGYCIGHITMTLILISINTPLAFIAVCSCGYLLPIGFLVFAFIAGVVINNIGYGGYYPWMIPAVFIESGRLEKISWFILLSLSSLGFFGSIIWWRYSDIKK
jgi:ABC-2 type transport system permease protein